MNVVFTNCALLLVCDEKIVLALGGDGYGSTGGCSFASCYIDFLGIKHDAPFLLDSSSLLIDNDVDINLSVRIRLVVLLLCFDY